MARGGEGETLELFDDPSGSGGCEVFLGLFSGHAELLTPRKWRNSLAGLVSNDEFMRDGMMPDGPSA
jgi:hypothetical protein